MAGVGTEKVGTSAELCLFEAGTLINVARILCNTVPGVIATVLTVSWLLTHRSVVFVC